MANHNGAGHDTPYNLLVDVGNTFLKWGRYRLSDKGLAADNFLDGGHALLAEAPSLAGLFTQYRSPRSIIISNVAGTRLRSMMLRAFEVWIEPPQPRWLISQPKQCGITNGYRNPAQLGVDRWCAMIGARVIVPRGPLVVVNCGTATTIDFISSKSEFTGGVILPGLGLMMRSLHRGTAALPDAEGEYTDFPKQTVDAMVSGCQHAQAGAIERLYMLHAARAPRLKMVISGGAAKALAPRITTPFVPHENLVLEGLHRIAQSMLPKPAVKHRPRTARTHGGAARGSERVSGAARASD